MKRLNFYFSEKQIAALKKVAAQSGISLSEIVRRAIDAFLAKK